MYLLASDDIFMGLKNRPDL
jgi:kinesin family member 2/24